MNQRSQTAAECWPTVVHGAYCWPVLLARPTVVLLLLLTIRTLFNSQRLATLLLYVIQSNTYALEFV